MPEKSTLSQKLDIYHFELIYKYVSQATEKYCILKL